MEEGQGEGVLRQGRREPRAGLDRRVAALRGGGEAGHCSGAAGGRGVAALEALFPVSLQHVGEPEALAAHAAGVRFLARVGAAVALHVGPAGEALAADFTDERFLSGMGLHMFIKILFHVKIFPTPLTHELLVADMYAHV